MIQTPAWMEPRTTFGRYSVAVISTLVVLLMRWALDPVLGITLPYTLWFGAVMIAGWLGGFGPGLLATVLGAAMADYFFVAPRGSWWVESGADVLGLLLFVLISVLACVLNESRRRSLGRAQRAEARAQQALADATHERARAEQASAMREDLLAIVSHDLRSPLAALLLQASAIRRHAGDDTIRKRARSIESSGQRMVSLIAALTDAALIDSGMFSVDCHPVDVTKLVRDCASQFAALAEDRGITLDVKLSGAEMQVACDGERLLQALMNLVGNAVKFTPAGGRVELSLVGAPEEIRIVVADTGPGIPAQLLPHIFERNWRTARHQGGGSGLGLYIAHGIIRAHGGELTVSSHPGAGSRFEIRLPSNASPCASKKEGAAASVPAP